ncbi:DNA polymerase III subunit epsilon [Pelagibius sp.]|uniref:DNA polymerase III subunit epsilon n=1 Tax=Pelagibius sp. TaxID=1931238 RepID=UPI00260CEEE9|nr:DNA polymerase III subunit epsilon [Pelagibius sp.]
MREIVLDTETTGLDPAAGHRVVEVAGLELLNHMPTGRTFREYINPERDMPEEAEKIHGLSAAFLADKPRFAEIAQPFLDFIGEAKLVIHNAQFDMKFLNAELNAAGLPRLAVDRAVDTVALARKRFPGGQVSLDALCRRFEIDNSERTFHGALLDCELLAEVYLELCGGRQPGLTLEQRRQPMAQLQPLARDARPARPHSPTPDEQAAHEAMLQKLTDPVWRQ